MRAVGLPDGARFSCSPLIYRKLLKKAIKRNSIGIIVGEGAHFSIFLPKNPEDATTSYFRNVPSFDPALFVSGESPKSFRRRLLRRGTCFNVHILNFHDE